jgi:hypothetical protein
VTRSSLQQTAARWLPLAAVAVALLLPLVGLLRAPGPPMEEGFMLVFPERVLHGDIPNKDFLHLYGPGSLWALASVFKVFGTSLWTERIAGYLQQVGLVLAVFAIARPWGRWVAAAGAIVTAVIIVPPIGLTALAWVGGVALGLWAMVAATSRRVVIAGLLAAAALLFRLDLVLAVTLGLVVAAKPLVRRQRLQLAGAYAGGLSLYLVHVAMAGPSNVWEGMVVEPIVKLRGGRRLPLPPSWSHFDGFLQKAGELVAPPWPFPAPPSPAQLSLWLYLLVATVVFLVVVGWRAVRADPTSKRARTLLVAAVFSFGLLPQAFQRADSTHLAWVSAVPLGLLPMAIAELLDSRRPSLARHTRTLVAAATPFVLLFVLAPHFTLRTYADATAQSFGFHRESHTIRNGDRVFYYGRQDATDAVNAMLADIDRIKRPGDRLFVGTGDLRKTPYSEAFLYYLLPDLPPATRYIEMDPGVANANDSGLADELANSDIVVLSSIRDDWEEPNDSRKFGSDVPNEVLARDFEKVGSYGTGLFGHGLYELYVRREPRH